MSKQRITGSIISPASKRFLEAAWQAQTNSPWNFLHSYVYARWPYLYIGLGNSDHPIINYLVSIFGKIGQIFHRDKAKQPHRPVPHSVNEATDTIADIYHGKVMPVASAQQLVMVNEPIDLPDLEQIIPYVRARALIQQNPDHILLMKCPCRMSKKSPCKPLEVCLVIGEPFVEFIHQYYPSRGRRITQQEACDILEREDARGRVHHAFFSEMMLGRFFAICNCCSCCCTAIKSHRRGTPMLASSGYVSQIDLDLCVGCGLDSEYCQFGALEPKKGICFVNEDKCMGCGVCVSKCPQEALSLRREPARGQPLEIFNLLERSIGDRSKT
jgi:ferredoxin